MKKSRVLFASLTVLFFVGLILAFRTRPSKIRMEVQPPPEVETVSPAETVDYWARRELQTVNRRLGELANKVNILEQKDIESDFFSRNERSYKVNDGKFYFGHCCTDVSKNTLGYDLIIERPDGSSDDFGTTSYMSFDRYETIEYFRVKTILSVKSKYPLYKVIVKTDKRYTEGIIFPYSVYDEIPSYSRLYEFDNNRFDYEVTVLQSADGYDFNVGEGYAGYPKEEKTYTLIPKGDVFELVE